MIRIREIALNPGHDASALAEEAARLLKISPEQIRSLRIFRRSIDARRKPDVKIVYTLDVTLALDEAKVLRRSRCKRACIVKSEAYVVPRRQTPLAQRPVVVGFGPAGMFAALVLALAGERPLVLERGEDARARREKVEAFFAGGALDPRSNVQFGEGGAGTFSDGKLHTGVNNSRIGWILEQFVAAGAPEEILYDAKPHVGTDILVDVVRAIRARIEALGGEVRFCAQVTGIRAEGGRLCALEINGCERIACRRAIFAIGHSARDTFAMLLGSGVAMEPKPFAMGVRIEHRQSQINAAQYGGCTAPLPPADYKLVRHLENDTVSPFCMCPGGFVGAAASEENTVVTNGMSNSRRDGENANAALLVTLRPADFPYPGPLGGVRWQLELERRAYALSGSYRAPAQRVGDFLAHRPSSGAGEVRPSYRPGVFWCDLHALYPEKITRALEAGIAQLDGALQGFANPDAVLTAPETRSSSPVRILRGEGRQCSVSGLYPCGEGAGYAGGIMSAAIDGMLTAETILREEPDYATGTESAL